MVGYFTPQCSTLLQWKNPCHFVGIARTTSRRQQEAVTPDAPEALPQFP
jgi:hypothetical protein